MGEHVAFTRADLPPREAVLQAAPDRGTGPSQGQPGAVKAEYGAGDRARRYQIPVPVAEVGGHSARGR